MSERTPVKRPPATPPPRGPAPVCVEEDAVPHPAFLVVLSLLLLVGLFSGWFR